MTIALGSRTQGRGPTSVRALAALSLLVLAGCGASGTSGASGASGAPAAPPAASVPAEAKAPVVTSATPTPALVPLALPERPIPRVARLPIVVPPHSTGRRGVAPGTIVETACFSATIPYAGIAQGAGCGLAFATQSLGPGTAPDVPYFTAEALADDSPTLDALERELTRALAKNDARIAATGTPFERAQLARRGPLGTDQGSYLGAREATIFGRPARVLTWGFTRDGRSSQFVDVITTLPAGRYVWSGKPLTALLVRGYTAGYQHHLFAYALAHLRMR